MGLTQDLYDLVVPDDPDFARASSTARRTYLDRAGAIVLEELSKQLALGVGRNGRKMKARLRAVLPDGADGPVMEPHYDLSRVITLADYAATDHSLKLFWHAGTGHASHRRARKQGRKPTPFGKILEYHADGLVYNAPVRDVRLSNARAANVRYRCRPIWERIKAGLPIAAATPKAPPKPAPKPEPKQHRHPAHVAPIPITGRVDFEHATFGIGGDAALAKRALDAGTFSGFSKLAPRPTKLAVEKKLGVTFTHAEAAKGNATVIVDLQRLNRELAKDAGFHVGPGGSGPSAKPGSFEGFRSFLANARQTKGAIEQPRLGIAADGSPTVIDGRHRLAVFVDSGAQFLPVSVPSKYASRFRRLYGVP